MIDRWCQMAAVPRYGLLFLLALGLLLLVWLPGLRPQQQALAAERAALSQLTRTLQQRQQQWRQHPAIAQLQAQRETMQRALTRAAASEGTIDDILAGRSHQLQAWQPDGPARLLTLHLPWQAFRTLFAEFAHASAPLPVHFLLLAQPHDLEAQLWLEPADAP